MVDDDQRMTAYFSNGEWTDGPDVLPNEWTDKKLAFEEVRKALGYSKFHDYKSGDSRFNIVVWQRAKYPDYMIQIETSMGRFEQIYTGKTSGRPDLTRTASADCARLADN